MLLADRYLQVVRSRGRRNLPLERVYRNMRRQGLFLKAYAKIYANDGATTVGTDAQDTIQGMSLARIDAIIEQLREGSYRWKPSRRTYIPKRNGSQRPLSVPNWSDKLVQEVMRMILEAYYEPQFQNSSHGFRPNRSCHTALREIKQTWTGTKWFIEGDIQGCFDNLQHEVIVTLLSRNIHDNRFLKLVKDMLRAGYVDDWRYHRTYSGAPQGGIISPILSNIVLHELDKYVEEQLIPRYTRGQRRKRNREYDRLWAAKKAAQQRGNKERFRALTKQLRQMPRHDPYDPDYRRLRYIRYADDFLLGFLGPKEEALAIKAELGAYLQQIGLTLSKEKTYVTHAREQAAKFLGYEITTAWDDAKLSLCRDYKIRALNGTIQLRVPRAVGVKWLYRYTRNRKPCYKGGYIELSDYGRLPYLRLRPLSPRRRGGRIRSRPLFPEGGAQTHLQPRRLALVPGWLAHAPQVHLYLSFYPRRTRVWALCVPLALPRAHRPDLPHRPPTMAPGRLCHHHAHQHRGTHPLPARSR